MKDALYKKQLRHAKDSPDGETSVYLYVTREVNAIIIWYDDGCEFPQMVPLGVWTLYNESSAIEQGVALAQWPLEELEKHAHAVWEALE